jgi:hypothetical protein
MKDGLQLDRSRLLGFKITSVAQPRSCDPRLGAKIGNGKPPPPPGIQSSQPTQRRSR